ncbi:General transcription factor 3C polypeptide 3 [Aphelenchoides besseyi]|nr:General transcription factor 3C polypeptide 3 [Aphelenchoides besseyi]
MSEFTSLSRMEIRNDEVDDSVAQYLERESAVGPSTSTATENAPTDTHFSRFINNDITYDEYIELSGDYMDETEIVNEGVREGASAEQPVKDVGPPAAKKNKKTKNSNKALFSDPNVPVEIQTQLQVDAASGEFLSNTVETFPQPEASTSRPTVKGTRAPRRTNKTIDNLMGQANVAYANNRTEEALSFLREAVRQDPRLPDAYQQMSDIYLDGNQFGRAFEYRLLAAHLDSRTSAADWSEIGEMAVKLERIEEAAACYGNSVRCDPGNWYYYEKRIELLDALGLTKFAMRIRLQAAQAINCRKSGVDFEWLQSLIKTAAEHYIQCLDEEKAMEALKVFLLRCHEFNRSADVQLLALLGMWISRDRYEECVSLILAMCPGIQALQADGTPAMNISISNLGYQVTPFMPNTVHHFVIAETVNTLVLGKLVVCLLNLHRLAPLNSLIDVLLKRAIHDAEEENAFLEIGRTYHKIECFNFGMAYMQRLMKLDPFIHNPNALFICGTLEQSRGNYDEASQLYTSVLEKSSSFVTARINLSTILQQKGDTEAALRVLMDYDLDSCSQLPDERLLMRQAEVLHEQKQSESYIRCIRMLLVPYFYIIYKEQNYTKRSRARSTQCSTLYRTMVEVLRGSAIEKQIRRQGAVAFAENRPTDLLSVIDIHDHSLRLTETLYDQKRYKEALEIVCLANLQPKIQTSSLKTFDDLILLMAVKAESFPLAFEYLRYLYSSLAAKPKTVEPAMLPAYNERLYNAINYVLCHYQNVAYHRFVMRAEVRTPNIPQLQIISGNNSLVTGSYRHAMSEYLQVWGENKEDPMITFLIALTFIHMACKKDISGKHMLTMRGMAFMNRYRSLRDGPLQEIFYNIGRMFHQLGLLAAAIQFYQRALNEDSLPLIVSLDQTTGQETFEGADRYDVRPCAAHNLALIYENSGNYTLARSIIERWCVI